ncbi:MAG: VanZ family protein [Verrucomicrobiota bacterium]
MTQSVRSILRPLSILAATGFIIFFIWIVTIANSGNGTPWWSFIHQVPYGDKIGHPGLIGILSFLCNLAFPSKKAGFLPRFVTLTTLILFVLLSLEELSQAFIKTRHLDFYDWLADLAGLAIGQFGAMWIKLKSSASSQP